MLKILSKNRLVIIYGISFGSLVLLLKWLEYRFLIIDYAFEVYVGAIALLFTGLGVWLTLKLSSPKTETVFVEKQVYITKPETGFLPDEKALVELGISRRELEVLELMSAGLSNGEIAERLFLSLNTIKSHSSNLFEKLDVKRRTQAVEKGKRLGLLA
ncbi:MAG: LuxR C-terminal-related transcriptional regulator [Bacteroidota bacterium]